MLKTGRDGGSATMNNLFTRMKSLETSCKLVDHRTRALKWKSARNRATPERAYRFENSAEGKRDAVVAENRKTKTKFAPTNLIRSFRRHALATDLVGP